jgi:methylamine dehydrogenase accessory protein MauD
MDWLALIARLLLIVIFSLAAVGKLADREGSRKAVADFGVPNGLAAPVALVLPFAELAIALLLIPGATARWGAAAALGMLALFIAGMAISLARGRRPECHCFGQLSSAPISKSTLLRNGALAAVAALVLWQGGENPDVTTIAARAGSTVVGWGALAAALIALALAAVEAWFILNLLMQQGRLMVRVDALEAALGKVPVAGLPAGQDAPEFDLRSLAGESHSLATLRASGRPALLFFTNPHCGPCDEILPEVARLQREHADQVNIAVITYGSPDVNREKAERHGLRNVLLQRKREVTEAYQVDSTPSAVLVSADGRIASQIGYGMDGLAELLHQAMNGGERSHRTLMAGATDGNIEPAGPPRPVVGEPAPSLVLPDLAGTATDLADFRGASTLVLFWSPACGFCQRMLHDLKTWERKRPARSPSLLVVSTGSVEANRAMGFVSPVVLDSDGSMMRAFGASGTPMAVLVDAGGRIASPLATGAQEVMALARTRSNESVRTGTG